MRELLKDGFSEVATHFLSGMQALILADVRIRMELAYRAKSGTGVC